MNCPHCSTPLHPYVLHLLQCGKCWCVFEGLNDTDAAQDEPDMTLAEAACPTGNCDL
jgi:hypothetical protein